MILHGLRIENWRNIGRLELAELDHPLVVLHGPNRTGKSSLFAALRSCLFDFDHDTTQRIIRDASPWQNKGAPEVVVEFEQQGARYRLTKRFSRNKDGFALLERRASDTQWTIVERDKEAGREVRRILGVEQSNAGLNQMLWLDQGETQLPEHRELSDTLQKRLQEVLGSLLTGRDWDFYRALEKAAEVYFTPKGEIKKASPVRDLEAQFELCRNRLDELQRRSAQGSQLLLEHESATAEIAEERTRVQETQFEVDALVQEREASRARRAEHSAARAELDNARSALEGLERQAGDIAQIRQRIDALRDQLAKADLAHEHFAQQHTQYRQDAEASQGALAASRRMAEQLEAERTALDDLRRLTEIAAALRELSISLAELEAIEAQIVPLDHELSTLAVPSEADLKKWRKNRSEAQKLRAELAAAALRISIEPAAAGSVNVEIDGSDSQAVEVEPGASREWSLRQRAALQIAGFGTIRFQRGREDLDLEQAARQLADLDRQYQDSLGAYGVDPSQEQAIELLADRGRRQASLAERLQSLQASVRKLAPSGRGALLAQQSTLEQERQQVAARHPDWADLQPTREAFDQRRDEFQARAAQCQAELKRAEAAVADSMRLERDADQQRQQAQLELTRLRTSQANLRQEL
ncbi:MAG TPA: AAA family ATPase, partial [Planctomycetaceae bacterium]|nr:AAA family ATPase [Planctomycetaceae bacterium]